MLYFIFGGFYLISFLIWGLILLKLKKKLNKRCEDSFKKGQQSMCPFEISPPARNLEDSDNFNNFM